MSAHSLTPGCRRLRHESPYGRNSEQVQREEHHQRGRRDQQQGLHLRTRLDGGADDAKGRAQQRVRYEFGGEERAHGSKRPDVATICFGQRVVAARHSLASKPPCTAANDAPPARRPVVTPVTNRVMELAMKESFLCAADAAV